MLPVVQLIRRLTRCGLDVFLQFVDAEAWTFPDGGLSATATTSMSVLLTAALHHACFLRLRAQVEGATRPPGAVHELGVLLHSFAGGLTRADNVVLI